MKGEKHIMDQRTANIIWSTYQQHGTNTALLTHKLLGFKKSLFYEIIKNEGKIPLRKQRIRQNKWSPEQIQQITEYVEQYPQATLSEIINHGVTMLGLPKIARSTLARYLQLRLITLKRVHVLPQERNSPEVKRERLHYANWFLSNQNLHFIFIDEFGFNVGMQRSRGRAPRGRPAYALAPLQRGANISVILAVDKNELFDFDHQEGAYDGDDFLVFIDTICNKITDSKIENACIIIDNCGTHSNIDEECGYYDINYKFLPRYSPFLTPIEECINDIKIDIKGQLSVQRRAELLGIEAMPWGRKTKARNNLVKNCLNQAMNNFDKDKFQAHFQHVMQYLPLCIRGEDINS